MIERKRERERGRGRERGGREGEKYGPAALPIRAHSHGFSWKEVYVICSFSE
jgi:hypothetical protein